MLAQPTHEAWLCDLDGTLYKARALKLVMALELGCFGLGAIRSVRAFRHEHEHLRRKPEAAGAPGSSPYQQQLARTARSLGIGELELQRDVEHWMIDRPCRWLRRFRREPLVHELRAFRDAGGKAAVVSDYPAQRKLQALELYQLFDAVVANGETDGPARLKPAPDGYLEAAKRLGVEPKRCLVIGDREDADGRAAHAAGMAFRLIR